MPQRVRLQKNQRVFRCAAFCCGIFFLISTAGSLGRAEEPKKEVLSSAGESGEKESSTTKGQDGANVQEVPAKGAGEAKKTEALLPAEKQGGEAPAKEEPLFFTAEEIYWGGSDEKSVLEIVAEEKVLPGGSVEVGANSRSLRWRPSKPLVIKMKKTNEVDSPLLQRVIFRENVVLTKRLGIEAPYYALDEIQMFFGSPVSYDLMQDGNWVSIECTPQKKKEEAKEVLEAPRKEDEIPLPEATSPAELLGTFFENKELYEAYITGSGRGADLFR